MQRRMLHLRLHAQHFVLPLLPRRRIEGVSDDERQQKADAQQDCTCCGAMVELHVLLAECAEKSSERRAAEGAQKRHPSVRTTYV